MSVLLDAGAGDVWTFQEPATGKAYGRSEGIAVASLYMFTAGVFSTVEGPKECVDGTVMVFSLGFRDGGVANSGFRCWFDWATGGRLWPIFPDLF